LLDGIDGRSAAARRYRDILAQLISDLGGDPSEAQSAIARRAATLATWCEAREAQMLNGEQVDISEFTTAVNAMRRLLSDLGLERRLRDVSPSLDKYIEARRATQSPVDSFSSASGTSPFADHVTRTSGAPIGSADSSTHKEGVSE
jgi:hypothetical protein